MSRIAFIIIIKIIYKINPIILLKKMLKIQKLKNERTKAMNNIFFLNLY